MQVKLRELFNTKYLYKPYTKDIYYVFDKIAELSKNPNATYFSGSPLHETVFNAAKMGTPLEFDLADIKLSPDVMLALNRAIDVNGIKFIDTADAVRNNILKTNRDRAAITVDVVDLPDYDLEMSIVDYINNLDPEVTYTIPTKSNIYLPLVFMVVCTRPSIKVDFKSLERRFFTFVGSRLPQIVLENYTEFFFNTKEGTVILDFSSGTADTQYKKNCTISDALMYGTLVPTCLGTTKLHQTEGFNDIFKECLNFLNNYRNTRKVKLSELL